MVDGKRPSGKIKVLYDSAVQKLLDEVGLSLLDAANKSEWHNITRPEALAAQARAASGVSAQVAAKSDLRNHRAIVQPRLHDCSMVTQITLKTRSPHGCFQAGGWRRLIRHGPGLIILTDYDAATLITSMGDEPCYAHGLMSNMQVHAR